MNTLEVSAAPIDMREFHKDGAPLGFAANSAHINTDTHRRYISPLCSALASMLMRYRKESRLKRYGLYFGDHSSGTVRPLHS